MYYYIRWNDQHGFHRMGPYDAAMLSWLLNRREFQGIEVSITTAKELT